MYKCFLFFFLLIGIILSASAQSSSVDLVMADAIVVAPSGMDGLLKKLPFRNLVVLDQRFDTSKLGYVKKMGGYKKLVTQGAFSQTMQSALEQQYSPVFDAASPYTLVVVLKNLWLQQTSDAEQEHHKIERSTDEATSEFSSCTASFEAYASAGDVYIPLFRRDSNYTKTGGLKRCAETLVMQPFEDCLQRAAAINVLKLESAKKKLSWPEIEAYNSKRLQYPRFATDAVDKGIYKTFQDFLQNHVAKQEFTVQYGAHTDEVFVVENGKPVALTNFWGFCDGTQNYIRIGMSVFALARQNNTYDIWGSKLSIHKYYRYTPGQAGSVREALIGTSLLNKNRMVTEMKPLQLNMETGDVY